jgi:hypothetical protein
MFGKFVVNSLSGLSAEEAALLGQLFDLEQVSDGGLMVSRGCGSYIQGATFVVKSKTGEPVTLQQALEAIEPAVEKGKLMVGGDFIPADHRVRLKDMPFNQGFRPFDANAYTNAVRIRTRDQLKLVVKGFFYSDCGNEENVSFLDQRRAQVVGDYRRSDQ